MLGGQVKAMSCWFRNSSVHKISKLQAKYSKNASENKFTFFQYLVKIYWLLLISKLRSICSLHKMRAVASSH